MLPLNQMDLADAFTPEQLVDEIFRQCPELEPPIPIKDLAIASGITDIVKLDGILKSENVEGLLVTGEDTSSGVIFYNQEDRPLGRQRFTIAHELGHFLLLHHNGDQTCTGKDMSTFSARVNKLEAEANDFSQRLLMPEQWIKKHFDSQSPSIEALQTIACKFETSFEATANKCTRYGIKPFALIYSKDNKIRYCWKDYKRLPFLTNFKKGDVMPLSSQALTLKLSDQSITGFVESDATDWFKSSPSYKLPSTVLEQTYFQTKGFKVTLITLIDS